MGRITKLVLHGFKSFAERTEIPFNTGFNVVLGPNGSGKSNIIDALCFVLGRLSTKSLRAEKAADLIFHPEKREGKKGLRKPAKKGNVTIYLDNSRKVFPSDTPEVEISRTVKPTGESIYEINDRQCTRQEILELLSLAKINPDGYNIIMQGDIDRFSLMSPEERRHLIEEISGISIYEDKKQKALHELEKVESKIKEAEIILEQRRIVLDTLRQDYEQAKVYRDLRDKVDQTKATLLHRRIQNHERLVERIKRSIEEHKSVVSKVNSSINEMRQEIERNRSKLEEIHRKLRAKSKEDEKELLNQINEIKVGINSDEKRIEIISGELESIGQRRTSLAEEKESIQRHIDSLKSQVKSKDNQIAELSREKKQIESKMAEFSSRYDLAQIPNLQKELAEIDSQLEKLQQNAEQLRQRQQELFREKDRAEYQLSHLKQQLEKLSELKKERRKEIEGVREKRDKLQKRVSSLNQKLEQDSTFARQLGELKSELGRKETELAKLQAKESVRKEQVAAGMAVTKIIEARERLRGIHNTVAALGKVSSRYGLALEVAAGQRMNDIVVDDDSVGEQCIRYLRESMLGVATFLPLNKIKPSAQIPDESRNKLRKQEGVIDFAIELVRFAPEYRSVFSYVFRNTLVVENLKVARRLGIGSMRMVTLDGDLLEQSGAMSGGSRKRSGAGFQQLESTDALSGIQQEVSEIRKRIEEIGGQRTQLESEINSLRMEKAEMEAEIGRAEHMLHLESGDLDADKSQREGFEAQLKEENTGLEKVQSELSRLNTEIMQVKTGKDKIRNSISQIQNPEIIAQMRAFEEELKRIGGEINSVEMEKRESEVEINGTMLEIERIKKFHSDLDKEERRFRAEQEHLRQNIDSSRRLLSEKQQALEQFTKENENLFREKELSEKRIGELETEILRRESDLRIEEKEFNDVTVRLATTGGELAGLKKEFEQYIGKRIEEKRSEKELREELANLETQIAGMGNVNLKALDTYENAEREYTELVQKKETLAKERQDVLNMIAEVEGKKSELFMQTFTVVSENFKRIFKELAHQGEVYLVLENEENPLEGGVLIMRELANGIKKDIRALSGGEKTITALAFIFAIQEHEPASFYILDEVDSELDKFNSEKFAKLLRKYSQNTQYILISHNDALLGEADYLYGISKKDGVSRVTTLSV